jgi:hypothetical protein
MAIAFIWIFPGSTSFKFAFYRLERFQKHRSHHKCLGRRIARQRFGLRQPSADFPSWLQLLLNRSSSIEKQVQVLPPQTSTAMG